MKAGVLAEPIMVGRKRELEQLESFLDSTLEGKGKTVFVSGEAGSGKTRLVREFLKDAAKKGVGVMAGWCLSDSAAPYFPFVEAFNNYFASFDEEEPNTGLAPGTAIGLAGSAQMISRERGITAWLTGTTVAERARKPEVVSPQVWKDQVYAGVAKTLHSISTQEPLVLLIEDIHWADSASLALLNYIARTVKNSERILVLATFRKEELTADAEGRPHPLAEVMRLMRREDLFSEIELASLDHDTVSKIAENMMGGSVQSNLTEKLAVESRGNPLFVVESLRMLHEQKSLIIENDQWRLVTDELGIPNKIKDIILRRLATLKYAQRRVLDAASVIGEKFDAELLGTVLQLDILEVLETLNAIANSTSLVNAGENFYRFDHATSRQTLYEQLSPPLKRGYHTRIAEKLESTKSTSLPLSDLAHHYAQAGNNEKAVKYALAAGKNDLAKWSNTQAIEHFRYALQNVPEGHAEEKRTALEGLGDAYAANSMYAEAIKIFDELAASETGAVKLRALRKATDAAFAKGDRPDILIEYAKKAEELGLGDRLEMARIINNRGHAWAWVGRGDFKQELADFDAALKVFEEENSLADTAEALQRSGLLSLIYEDLREKGLGKLLRAVAILRELGDIRKETAATLNLGEGFSFSGLFAEERCEYAKILRIGEKLGAFDELALASVFLGAFDEEEGKFAEALSHSLKALEYSKKTDANYVQNSVNVALARQYSLIGDLRQADEYFEKIRDLSPETSTPGLTWQTAITKGIYLTAKGRWEEANQIFKESRERGEKYTRNHKEMDAPWTGISAAQMIAWALEKQGLLEAASVLRERAKSMTERFLQKAEAKFGHAKVQLSAMVPRKVQVGEEFEMRFDLINVGKKSGKLIRIRGAVPPEFKVMSVPDFCSLKNGNITMEERGIEGFEVETIKIRFEATKAGNYDLDPELFFMDDLGKTKTFKPNPITVTAQPAKPAYEALPGRVITGTFGLDKLLLGGIPENYDVALSAPSSDERSLLIKRFLEAGSQAGDTTFFLTADAANTKDLAEKYPSNFYLFLCNPQADAMIRNAPNVFKLKGVENLTDIDIALTKAFRTLDPSAGASRRICVDIVSDVLLQHKTINARRWLSSLLPTLKSKGFTILGVIDPEMHPPEETQGILNLFDGQIDLYEKQTPKGPAIFLRVKKMTAQKYLKEETTLIEE